MSDQKPLVLITGVTGYVGSAVLNEFLQGEAQGKYRVRATVRDMVNTKKMEPLIKYFGVELLKQVEFVNADCLDSNSIEFAVQGCDYVVHTASPVGRNPKDHEEMIRPAVNGVKFVM